MAAVSGVNIAMLPEEHAEYWAYPATTGDIWARALADGSSECRYEPCPPALFLKRYAKSIENYDCVDIYLGFKDAILKPRFQSYPVTEGDKKVVRPFVYHAGSQLIRYGYGIVNKDQVMSRTTTSFYSTYLVGNEFRRNPDEFLKWARKVTAWLRRRIAGEVPVYRCNYAIPASALTIEAAKSGLKVV